MKKSVYLNSVFAGACFALSLALPAQAESFNIPAGDLQSALATYMKQTGVHLMISEDAIKGAKTRGVQGELPADSALTRILSGTGFTIKRDSTGITGIIPQRASQNSSLTLQNLQLAQANPATGRIEEVLVTARKREESVENIPISITALSAEDLKTFGIRNFADLEGVVPGLSMGGGGNGVKKDSNPFIRGVGQRETKVTLDPAVATYIDGIYIGRAAGAMLDVVDVDNIQVLRGPQGTLFGRNATGGALSVTLKKPNNNWEAEVSANIGNYGRRDLTGIVNIPFVEDMVLGRFMVASVNSNGYFTNIVDNTKWGDDNRVTGIAQLRILPTDNITIDLLGERTRIRETPRPQKCSFLKPTGFTSVQTNSLNSAALVDGYNRYEGHCRRSEALPQSQFSSDLAIGDPNGREEILTDRFTGEERYILQPSLPRGRYWVDTTTAGGTVNWDVGGIGPFSDVNAKSITAWRKTKQIADEDLDAIGSVYLVRIQPTFDETTQFSQEIQLSGKTLNDRLFLSTGGFYFKERTPQNDLILSAGLNQRALSDFAGPFVNTGGYEPAFERLQTNNHSWAWYGQADFELTPEIELTGGIRWTTETRWSRYSKGIAIPSSVVTDTVIGTPTANQGVGTIQIRTANFGLNPVLNWQFGSPDYSVTVLPGDSFSGRQTLVQTLVPGRLVGDELSHTNAAWTPMFSVKYKASDNILQKLSLDQAMLYATYSQGFHSGGVTAGAIDYDQGPVSENRLGPPCALDWFPCLVYTQLPVPGSGFGTADPITFEPEKVVNYEVGLKLAGLDRRIQASVAAFYMDYTNMQVTAIGNRGGIPIPFIENVGASVIQGIELELVALPTPQWRVLVNGSYTDSDIKEWTSTIVGIGTLTGMPDGTVSTVDRDDERMPRVPRWQFFASTEYNFNLGGSGTLTPSVGVRFMSSIYHGFDRGSWIYSYGGSILLPFTTEPTNITPEPGAKWKTTSRPTAFLDARLAWVSGDGKLEAALWGKNLTNKDDYLVGGIPLSDVTGAVGQVFANPRTFGLTFTYHFGE